MKIMVQLNDEASQELQGSQRDTNFRSDTKGESDRLLAVLTGLGVKLEPVHPGQTHPLLIPFFMIQVTDRRTADEIIERLQQFKIVAAAYLKPDEQLP